MTGAMVGSPRYMAPERFTAGHDDHSVDIYAMGCLLFELLTARAPFPATEPAVGTDSDEIQPAADAGGTVAGGEPGLYGGRRDNSSCDRDSMIAFLRSHPDEGAAWGGVQGIPAADVPGYISGLTAVALRSDTAVTNHGFRNQEAAPFQAVLQSGTAVLVDLFGVPRAKCYCGNPLLPPQPLQYRYSGTPWPDFSPQRITAVTPAAAPVRGFRLVDMSTGLSFTRASSVDDEDGDSGSTEYPVEPTGTEVPGVGSDVVGTVGTQLPT
jgi:serine/threonine protein kinase